MNDELTKLLAEIEKGKLDQTSREGDIQRLIAAVRREIELRNALVAGFCDDRADVGPLVKSYDVKTLAILRGEAR